MAKKKKDAETDVVEETNIDDDIIKEFGNIILNAQSMKELRSVVIPVSPSIDIGLGGGVPEGTWFTLTGKPKVGKTVTALHFAANAQKLEYAGTLCPNGRMVYYLSIEGRIKERDLDGIPGLVRDRFRIIQSTPGNILNAEKFLSIAEKYVTSTPGCVLILDSYSALCTDEEMSAGMDKMQRADGAKLLAKFCRKLANVVPINKNIIVGITHIMANPSGMGAGHQEKSGNSIAYQCDTKLYGGWTEEWKVGDTQVGQKVHWDIKFSAIGPPGPKIVSYLRYGMGIDEMQELSDIGASLGLIKQKASWYELIFLELGEGNNPNLQGLENVRNYLEANPDVAKKLQSQIYNLVGI
jgi:recombination protein RecA